MTLKTISRKSDMGEGVALTLLKEPDGDIILDIHPEDHAGSMQSIQFCLSGTQSPKTTIALNNLFIAMQEDQKLTPHALLHNE